MKLANAILALLLLAPAGFAAVDPDLIVLDAKVDALGGLLGLSRAQLAFYLAQRADHDVIDEILLADLNQLRQLQWEQVLLDCATDPGSCVMPQVLTTFALIQECTDLAEDPGHPEESSYVCALRELVQIVDSDIAAVERQGLPRNTAAARQSLDAAIDAAAAGDAESAFWSTCAAFKAIACR